MTAPAARKFLESMLQRFITSHEAMKPASVEDAYRMGQDYALNGPNDYNCHFRLFATPQHTRAWEKGKADAASF